MARKNQKIFIEKSAETQQLEDGYWYSYSEGMLRIYKEQELVYEQKAVLGEGFEVISIEGTKTHVTPVTLPRNDGEAAMWLLGLGKNDRTQIIDELTEIEKRKRNFEKWEGHEERAISGATFLLIRYNIPDKSHSGETLLHGYPAWEFLRRISYG